MPSVRRTGGSNELTVMIETGLDCLYLPQQRGFWNLRYGFLQLKLSRRVSKSINELQLRVVCVEFDSLNESLIDVSVCKVSLVLPGVHGAGAWGHDLKNILLGRRMNGSSKENSPCPFSPVYLRAEIAASGLRFRFWRIAQINSISSVSDMISVASQCRSSSIVTPRRILFFGQSALIQERRTASK